MRSLNRVILIGRLAQDPKVSTTKTNKKIAHFSIATNYDTTVEGEKKQYTEFHRITAWGRLAETSEKWLKKGMGVYIEGRLHNSTFVKDGQKKTKTDIVLDTLNILKWKKGADAEEVNVTEPGAK